MTLLSFIRLLLRFKWMLISAPIVSIALVFALLRDQPDSFESRTVVYTGLVSGFNIESGSDARMDFHVVNSGFDNLINTIRSRETLLRASTEALARISCAGAYSNLAQEEWYVRFQEEVLDGVQKSNCPAQLKWIQEESENADGFIYELLFRSKTPLSLASILSNLSVKRVASSDLLEIRYSAPDPKLTQDLLQILNDSFIERYQQIKRREVGSVVQFFEVEVARSYERLQLAVNRMRDFGSENRVINYYEQTKAIAGQKELIDQQIQQEEMRLESAEAAVLDLELRIGASEKIREKGADLVKLRQQFTDKTVQSVLRRPDSSRTEQSSLSLTELSNQIEQGVAALYNARYSKEGFVKTELVERWLGEMVTIAEAQASLAVLNARRSEYIKVYDRFAPMGSTLSTLEREVDVAESEYLELLRSLNQARMREQNIELSSSMDVLDQPVYPQEPKASKLHLLMLAAYMVTFILCLGSILAIEILDQSLRAPTVAKRRTGLDVIGFLPNKDGSDVDEHRTFNERMCTNHLTTRLITLLAQDPEKSTHLVCIASVSNGDGKSYVGEEVDRAIRSSGRNVLRVTPNGSGKDASDTNISFPMDSGYASRESVSDLMSRPISEKLVILMELPSLSQHEIPVRLLQNASTVLWVASADSLWGDHESGTLEFVKKLTGIEPKLVLNRVKWDHLDEALGGMAKRRSLFRKSLKRLLQRNFS